MSGMCISAVCLVSVVFLFHAQLLSSWREDCFYIVLQIILL